MSNAVIMTMVTVHGINGLKIGFLLFQQGINLAQGAYAPLPGAWLFSLYLLELFSVVSAPYGHTPSSRQFSTKRRFSAALLAMKI